MAREFTAVIYEDECDERYEVQYLLAYCPEIDLMTQGETIEDAKAMLKEAVEGVLELMTPEGLERRMREGPPDHPEISDEDIFGTLTELERDVLSVDVKLREASLG